MPQLPDVQPTYTCDITAPHERNSPECNCACDCRCTGSSGAPPSGAPGKGNPSGGRGISNFSQFPIRYLNGNIQHSVTDFEAGGYGKSWGHARHYINHVMDRANGVKWLVEQWPYIAEQGSEFGVVWSSTNIHWFEESSSGVYSALYGSEATWTYDSVNKENIVRTPDGEVWIFTELSVSTSRYALFKKHYTAGGQLTDVISRAADDSITEVQRSATVDSTTTIESFKYDYFSSGENKNRLQYVTLRRKVDSGSWTDVRRIEYEYYLSTDTYGEQGDLKRVKQQILVSSTWTDVSISYYRYYTSESETAFHDLKYIIGPDAYARLDVAVADPLTASDATVADYADHYFEYDGGRVTKETVNAGSLTSTFSYTLSAHADSYSNWDMKTVETLPDGNQNIVYTNYIGQVLLREYKAGTDSWIEYQEFNSDFKRTLYALPSAVSSYDDTQADLNVTLNSSSGLIQVFDYYTTTGSGALEGELQFEKVKEGNSGTEVKLKEFEYVTHTADNRTVHRISKEKVFKNEDGTGAIETSYSYTWHSGEVIEKEKVATLPVVPTSQNGSGVAATRKERFDIHGNLIWAMDELGVITRYIYDTVKGVRTQLIQDVDTTQVTDEPVGWTTVSGFGKHLVSNFEYDDYGRLTQSLGPEHDTFVDGSTETIRTAQWTIYDELNYEVRTASGYGSGVGFSTYTLVNPVSIMKKDSDGRVTEEIQATRASTSGKLADTDTFAQASYVRWKTKQYDNSHRLERQRIYHSIPSSGSGSAGANYGATTYTYNNMDRLQSVVNPLSNCSTMTYDSRGFIAAEIKPLGSRTSFMYDADGNRIQVENPLNNKMTIVFDFRGRSIGEVSPLGHRSTFSHNNRGCLVSTINALENRSTTLYDDAGRSMALINALGNRMTSMYDNANQIIATINALGNRSTSVYDSIGNQVAVMDGLGNRSTSVYNDALSMIASINSLRYRTTYIYDATGRRVCLIDSLNRRTTSGYDTVGRQTLRIDAHGNRTTYAFDANDQQTGRKYPDGSRVTFAYDANGNRTLMNDGTGAYTTTYDVLNRTKTVVNPANKKITYAYDAVGQRDHMIDPDGGRFTYSYDAAGRIDHLLNPQGDRTSYSYDAASRSTLKKLANGTRASFTYDNANNLITLYNLKSNASVISGFEYSYDNTGKRTNVVDANGDRVTWTYNTTYQLTREQRSGANAYDTKYTYDAVGNCLFKDADSIMTTTIYDAANQIQYSDGSSGRTTYTFDANGNQQVVLRPNGDRTTNTWDVENQSTKVELPNGTINTMAYNADSKRILLADSTGTTKFIWDGDNYLAETTVADATKAVFTNVPQRYGDLISQRRDGTTDFYNYDAIGSTRELTGALESITDTYLYSAFGVLISQDGTTTNPFRYVGRQRYYYDHDSGNKYIIARSYDPVIARWLSADPLGFSAFDMNLYRYVGGNPMNAIDPSGRIAVGCELLYDLCVAKCLGQRALCLADSDGWWEQRVCDIISSSCLSLCMTKYVACKTSDGLGYVFCTLKAATNWLAAHPEVIVGAMIVVAGTAYIVSTGGSGLILIPLVL